jgi:hypothetical protein
MKIIVYLACFSVAWALFLLALDLPDGAIAAILGAN